ncbi:MAG: HAMP domain-containing sensor histidine kinase [Bacteroidota bacterium]|nr:HAMP domain-containing histidine kinase [Candidatus Kapabacteria bacterium]MDW8220615.1 HAMP domain-containing sensor histidine kinase [Bacteroidota bacterium]
MSSGTLRRFITDEDIEQIFASIIARYSKDALIAPCEHSLLPATEFARAVHQYTMSGALKHDATVLLSKHEWSDNVAEFLAQYWRVSAFHWKAAANLATLYSDISADTKAELHWNAILADIACTGVVLRYTPHFAALAEAETHSTRARQISYLKYCLAFPTIEAYSESLARRDLTKLERMILAYGEACCYAARKDEERFEHSVCKFVDLCSMDLPAMSAPAYNLVRLLRQFGKSSTEATTKLHNYIQSLRTQHSSPFVQLHTEILYHEDTLNFGYWAGSVKQKILWTFRAVQVFQLAYSLGLPTSWYSDLQFTIAQRSSYAGIYDIAHEMIQGLEQKNPLYTLMALGYYWAEQEQYEKAASVYQKLIELIEKHQSASARETFETVPMMRQQDIAFCYFYAAQVTFYVRRSDEHVSLCAGYIEKFFLWSEYLSQSARRVLQKNCQAMQSELTSDLQKAVEHYEEYMNLLTEDDYISKIKTLSHLAQLYAEYLQNFTKADEHLQALKRFLPRIQRHSSNDFDLEATGTDEELLNSHHNVLIQLWLTKYSLKATQKVMTSLDSVTSQLGLAFRLLESQHERLITVNQNLVELNKEKNEFLGIVAHDLKNPLASILLGIEMLQRYGDRMTADQRDKKYRDIIATTRRMQAIITNLLDVNALDTGKIKLTPTPFNLVYTVRAVVDDYRDRAKEKGILLHYEAESKDILIIADNHATVQILDNLVSNAIKYSPFNKNVWIGVKKSDNQALCFVKDEGPGLSEEDKKKLFGKYARLSAKPTGGEHSTGLGLSIVKKLAEAMNGSVWCESELGKGATFFLVLPLSSTS